MGSFFFTLFAFASMEVASKPLMGIVSPFVFNYYRFLLGFTALFLYMIFSGKSGEIKNAGVKKSGKLMMLGVLNIFFSMSLLQLAVSKTNAATAAAIISSNPIFVLAFSLFFKMEKFELRKVIAIILGICGIAFIMTGKGFSLHGSVGELYGTGAAISFALYTVLSKKYNTGVSHLSASVISFGGGLTISTLFILFNPLLSFSISSQVFESPAKIALFLYVGVIISGIAYITFFRTLARFTATASSIIFILKPVIASFLAFLLLGEKMNLYFFIGLFFITSGGIYLVWPKFKEIMLDRINRKTKLPAE